MALRQITQGFMRNHADAAGGDHAQAMIHPVQVEALQIGNVAGDVKRQDLPLAVR